MAKRILVVDDTPVLRTGIKDILQMEGYTVSTATNGKEAFKRLLNDKYDLVITDLLMPEMNGFELIQQIRNKSQWRAVRILVYSAMPFVENNKRVLEQGASSYLEKPSSLDELVRAVYQLIRK